MESLSIFTVNPDGSRTEFALTDGLTVGRAHDCDVRVASAFLSRVHFSFAATPEGFVVASKHRHNAGSRVVGVPLGVYVNDERVHGKQPVKAGDILSTAPDPAPNQPVFHIGPTVQPVPAGSIVPGSENKGCLAALFGG